MLKYTYWKSPVGLLELCYETADASNHPMNNPNIKPPYLCGLSKVLTPSHTNETTAFSEMVIQQLDEYFSGERKTFTIPLSAKGTSFQHLVWDALCTIPYGETRSYGEIAKQIGNPKASRAVGMANHNNPIGIIVPCHRVIGANGTLTGYAGGLDMKQYLLELEQQYNNSDK